MTTEQLTELRRLLAEATPGPWNLTRTTLEICIKHHTRTIATLLSVNQRDGMADAALIAAVVNALPELLDAAEREAKLRAVLTEQAFALAEGGAR